MRNKKQPPQSPLSGGGHAEPANLAERIAKGLWWDRALTLVEGCTNVSPACDNCWAESATAMRSKQKNEKIQERYKGLTNKKGKFNGKIKMMWKALKIPASVKKPTVFAVWNDLFHDKVNLKFQKAAWDMMWGNSHHTFIVLTKRPERMFHFIKDHAWAGHFGWLNCDYEPFQPGEVVSFEDLFYRYRCGYNGWGDEFQGHYCDHSDNNGRDGGEREESCDEQSCPIGYSGQLKDKLVEWDWNPEDYEFDEEGFADDTGLLELHTRPGEGAASNIILMTTVESSEYLHRLNWLQRIKEVSPFYRLGVSAEPVFGDLDLSNFLSKKFTWNLSRPTLRKLEVPYIDWVIMGCESGANRRPMDIEWVRKTQKQCEEANVAFFLKQMEVGGKVAKAPMLDGKQYLEFPRQLIRDGHR